MRYLDGNIPLALFEAHQFFSREKSHCQPPLTFVSTAGMPVVAPVFLVLCNKSMSDVKNILNLFEILFKQRFIHQNPPRTLPVKTTREMVGSGLAGALHQLFSPESVASEEDIWERVDRLAGEVGQLEQHVAFLESSLEEADALSTTLEESNVG